MRKLIIAAVLGFFVFPINTLAAFSDVPTTHKYYPFIEYLQAKEVIGGYPDGTYKPDKSVSRAEAMKIIISNSGLQAAQEVPNTFSDVQSGVWYTPWILIAKHNGVVEGYSDGTFGVTKEMNLAEAMKIILKAYNVQIPASVSAQPYNDVPANAWYAPYFAVGRAYSLLDFDANGNVNPDQTVTRGMLAQIMARLLFIRDAYIASQYGTTGTTTAPSTGYYMPPTAPTVDPNYYNTGYGDYSGTGEMSDSTYNALHNALLEDHAATMNVYEGIDGYADYDYSVDYGDDYY